MAASISKVRFATRILRPVALSNVRCFSVTQKSFEQVTHTGQKYDDKDWKRVRFMDKQKTVNPNIAQNLVAEEEIIEVDGRTACCNGGGGALGHPKVFINLDKPGAHPCGYCGLQFIKKPHHH